MEPAKPQKEHDWLQQLVGEWTFEMPGMEPGSTYTGKETVRSIGGLWIQAEGRGQMPDGQPAIMMLTLGYDPGKKAFVGTWLGSMMTNLWVYEGSLDESSKVLTLTTEGPTCTDENGMARYKEVVELVSDRERTFNSFVLDENGEWRQIMSARYRRSG